MPPSTPAHFPRSTGHRGVVAEVFDLDLTPELFAELDRAASSLRPS